MLKLLFLVLVVGSFSLAAQTDAIPFINIETPPRFKNCAAVSKEADALCTQKSIEEFAKQKFNTGLFKGMNLNEKRIRIYAQFIINTSGNIQDIRVRTPYPQLEKEMKRVIDLLPIMVPGRHQDKVHNTLYSMPIVFTLG